MNSNGRNNRALFLAVAAGALLLGSTAFAQEPSTTDAQAEREAARAALEAEREAALEARAESQAAFEADREAALEARAEAQAAFEAERAAAQADIQTAREDAAAAREEIIFEAQAARDEARANASSSREERQAEMETIREERRAAMSEQAKTRITNLAANISNKMDTAADRIQHIIDRLETRMDTLREAGLDTNEAESILASAQRSLDAATTDLASIDSTVQTAVSSEDPREQWQNVKLVYSDIRTQLRTAHSEIKAAVEALKSAARDSDTRRGAAPGAPTDPEPEEDSVITNEE